MNDDEKLSALKEAIDQLQRQKFAKEVEITMIDAQLERLQEQANTYK